MKNNDVRSAAIDREINNLRDLLEMVNDKERGTVAP
jgi:hypothetical protein